MVPANGSHAAEQHIRWHPATRELVGGVLAGAVNVTSGYPFDTLKVRLQASNGAYTGMIDCLRHIWKTDGVRGFFRGLSSPLIGGAAETGVNYLVYSRVLDLFKPQQQQQQQQQRQQQQRLPDMTQHLQQQAFAHVFAQPLLKEHHHHQQQQQQQRSSTDTLPPLRAVPVAGAVAGVALSVILSPTELIKCRMQMAQFNSPLRCLQNVLQTEGAWGLTRGFVPTLCREIPGNALFFTVYEGLRRNWPGRPVSGHGSSSSSSSDDRSRLATGWQVMLDAGSAIVCGGLAGVVMWSTVLPLDVAKTRIQTAQPGTAWDTGVMRQLIMMWREGGRHTLWAGLAPTVARAFPANACQWLAWEFAMRQLLPPAYEPSDLNLGSLAVATKGQQDATAAAL